MKQRYNFLISAIKNKTVPGILIPIISVMISFSNLTAQNISKPEKVKSVTELSIETKNGKDIETKRSFQSFDEKGNVTEEIEYDDDGKMKDHSVNEYNSQNQKIKETHFLPDGKIESITSYTYDQYSNRTTKTVTTKDGVVKSKKVFRYEYR